MMGWSYETHPSRLKEYLADLTRDEHYPIGLPNSPQGHHVRKCLAKKYIMSNPGNGRLWTVWEYHNEDSYGNLIGQKTRYIGYDLISWGGGKGLCWGHKEMTASSGIGDISCPAVYLDMVPEPGGCARHLCGGCGECWERSWRVKVRAAADEATTKRRLLGLLKPGDKVIVTSRYTWSNRLEEAEILVKTGFGASLGLIVQMPNGQARVPLTGIDFDKTLALRTGVEIDSTGQT